MDSFTPSTSPVLNSVALSALVALLPLLTFFFLLAFAKTRAYVAGGWALLVALAVGVLGFGMPIGLALLSATQGAAFGLFPVVWIIVMAVWLYQVTVLSGRFEDLRRVFDAIGGGDLRVQAILVAFCFGGLLEALAGFGAPVAITVTMLLALGIAPIRAATAVLVANTAPVAFGALAIPITTAANLTNYTGEEIGAVVGRQTPVLAVFVPLILLFILDGRRGLRDCWPVALFTGVVFSVFQFLCSNYFSYELTDIVASLVAMLAAVGFLRFWHPRNGAEADQRMKAELAEARADGWTPAGSGGTSDVLTSADDTEADRLTPSRAWMALFPYVAVIVIFGFVNLWTLGIDVPAALAKTNIEIPWPVLHEALLDSTGQTQSSTIYSFEWLISPGTLLLITGLIVALVYSRFNENGRYPLSMGTAVREIWTTAVRMRSAALTILGVLALAYVMNFSGQTVSIGTWLAGTGAFFAFLSPVLGWIGTAVTGSDTSANALFAKLQQTAGIEAGLDPQLMVAANTGGGVMGKLISPQNLAIGAAAVNMSGQESVLLRKVIGWSVLLLLALCILVFLQSTPVLEWMLP
ncbi:MULTISPECIES: L-lactate permease [unclassified Arthrobacter]|uniref:L-lactate permease n=1 Tax=unclassified Arthrobacter TaxID=235627 RepID=UPI001E566A35|nr:MULTISPECIES: L-lactate permease [unclassified Arthrobacter]MCC9145994.1 L-lactate permease [Arthrobacter sp. zg-Y919]MDK1277223.1 L-lactate permease [Arthrobacter sp. zg.Y919]WIB03737.1 L-lactate permease [Arthrobacter sp. zg-Y919]